MVKSSSTADAQLCAAALRLAGASGWEKVTLAAVAKAAKMPLAALEKRFAGPVSLVPLIAAEIDREAFAAVKISGTPHDILFDLLMARFDVMQKHRKAILSMAAQSRLRLLAQSSRAKKDARHDRNLARALACATLDGAYRIVDAAKLKNPPRLALVAGITAIYGAAFFAWRRDESRDMAKTMAALDRALRWAAQAMKLLTPRS